MTKIKKIQGHLLKAVAFAATFIPLHANAEACAPNVKGGVKCAQGDLSSAQLTTSIKNGVNTIIFAAGIIAVVVIIVGGIRYTVSQGDEKSIESAKNTILYAVIGLVIAVLAFALVNFVLKGVSTGTP